MRQLDTRITENSLLARLPLRQLARALHLADRVTLQQGEVLSAVGDEIRSVYFPENCTIAEMSEGSRSQSLAVGLIGAEGMVGAAVLLGRSHTGLRAQVHDSGRALRLKVEDFRALQQDAPELTAKLMLYIDLMQAQYAQVAACASFHVLDKRLAWWLLLTHDRVIGDRFDLTHDQLAAMLGVRRSGVSTAAGSLRKRKIIGYSRGRIVIRDRRALELAACCCYRRMRAASRLIEQSQTELRGDLPSSIRLITPQALRRVGARSRGTGA
ncbi:Crp/Fnr family transcriptional regulator [Pseudomarimonas salicorniae]|uniref:CRP-like protein Clp n=1 Tax=Pseudomarimonas salicorniae TaxID=2933270 RepID=A0ABT0GEV5_9GAMM|nr:Crp/Fnr family transcriptional regulator [Lysobacter sp. CAU 1642]MCK7593079.1 Crp/Fnr family transcriptional regulator [Lysobacter sp. CAU 1642]